MNRSLRAPLFLTSGLVAIATLAGAIAFAQESKPSKPQDASSPPPGMSEADMKACMEAATPGTNHQKLLDKAGTWTGDQQMWSGSDATTPATSPTTWTMTSLLDGRYLKTEVTGDMPGMGPYHGAGVAGYDNVSKQFVADWIDNMGTGIMQGAGELSSDGKMLTWKYTFNCPITKKQQVMREIQKFNSADAMTVEFFCTDPKTGKDYKCMQAELKKSR